MQQPTYPAQALADLRNPTFVSFIDMARWIAAAIVFLSHLRNPVFLGFERIPVADRSLFVKAWFFATGLHAEAVIVFFVLSGYLVGGMAAARVQTGQFRLGEYLIDRISRIYLPYFPALLLTAALDWIGSHYLNSAGLYTHEQTMIHEKIASGAFVNGMTPAIFLMNLLMQQTLRAQPYGSNDPLWTISLEFWFYIFFALAVAAMLSGARRTTVLWALGLLTLAVFLGSSFFIYFGLWLIGVGVAFIPWRSLERPMLALALFIAILLVARFGIASVRESSLVLTLKNYAIAAAFGWLLLSMRGVVLPPLELIAPLNAFMAKFSYSLYLVHFPLMIFVLSALYATGRFPAIATGYSPADPQGLEIYGLVALVGFAFAYIFASATELQTWRLRGLIKRRFRIAKPSAA